MYLSLYGYVHVGEGACGDQKRALDILERELKGLVSCLTQVLGTELRSYGSTQSSLTIEL